MGKGWEVYAACLGVAFTCLLASPHSIQDEFEISLLGSTLLGAGIAAKSYFSLSNENEKEKLPTSSEASLSTSRELIQNPELTNIAVDQIEPIFANSLFIIPNIDKEKHSSLSKLAASLGLGWVNFAAVFPMLILCCKALDIHPNQGKPFVFGVSTLCGIAASIHNFTKKPPVGSPPPTNDNIPLKIAKSAFQGLYTASATLGTLFMAMSAHEALTGRHYYYGEEIMFGLAGLAGISHFGYNLRQVNFNFKLPLAAKAKDASVSAAPVNGSLDLTIANTQPNNISTLAKLAQSLGVGWMRYTSSLPLTFLIGAGVLGVDPSEKSLILFASAFFGAIFAIKNFKTKKIVHPPSSVQNSHLSKIGSAVFAGYKIFALTGGTVATAIVASEDFNSIPYQFGELSFGISIFAGIIASMYSLKKSYPNLQQKPDPGLQLYTRWKNMSKTKKAGFYTASIVSMLGLAILCVGPDIVARQITGLGNAGVSAMNDLYTSAEKQLLDAQNQFINTVYTIKSETMDVGQTIKSEDVYGPFITHSKEIKVPYVMKSSVTTKTRGEWWHDYTALEEANRLIQAEQELAEIGDKISCAEVLLTCHLPPDDAGHKKMYKLKQIKLHPDKFKKTSDKEVANKAFQILSKTEKDLSNCEGQKEFSCEQLLENVTIHKEFITLDSRYTSLLGVEPECYFYPEGAARIKADS